MNVTSVAAADIERLLSFPELLVEPGLIRVQTANESQIYKFR